MKRTLAFLLAMLMLCFTACGSETAEPVKEEPAAEQTASAEPAAPAEEAFPTTSGILSS